MKRLTLIILSVGVLLGVASVDLDAQEQGTRIVFVNSQEVIAAHPAGEEAARIEEQARQETDEIRSSIEELAQRAQAGQELTPEEQERYQTLVTTLQTVQQRYQSEFNAAAQPAVEAVNAAIAAVAEENGYGVVLDSVAAGPQGTNLVVYAQPGLDITEMVIERVASD